MDVNQFEELLKMMNLNNEKMLNVLMQRHIQTDPKVNSNNVTILPNFDQFDSTKETFKQYIQRFENFLKMKNVFNDLKLAAQMLLNSMGPKNYTLLTSLSAPKMPNELEYQEIVTLMEKHINPKKNVIVEQHRFLSCTQGLNQNIAEYVAALKQITTNCEFICACKSTIDYIFLRAQFIRGIRDQTIREQLLMSTEMTFDQAVEKAQALEASKIDSQTIASSELTSTSNMSNEINRISRLSQRRNQSYYRHPSNQRATINNRNQSKSRIDYRKLGIDNCCLRCGRNNHRAQHCRINRNKLKCNLCQLQGHIEKVCIKSLLNKNENSSKTLPNTQSTNQLQDNQQEIETFGINNIVDIFGNDTEKYYAKVFIEGKLQEFEVDSGSGLTLLPEKALKKLNIRTKLNKTSILFRSYTTEIFKPLGNINVNVEFKKRKSKETLYIVPDNYSAVLGREWIRHLGIDLKELDIMVSTSSNNQINIINTTEMINDIESTYAEIFTPKVGIIPNFTCSLKLRPGAKPVFIKEREIPYAIKAKVERELDELETQGIITKTETSDWGSPLVVIPKSDGGVRLCVDYKVAVNPQLEEAHSPIPKIETVLNNLRNSRYFCTLDLFKAYLHVLVDDDSKKIQTISTHRGTYLISRLSFGIKSAPSEFNRIINQILANLEGVECYFDDIIIHGSTLEITYRRLKKCLDRLQEFNIHVNRKKCQFFKEEISYLGYVISLNKIKKCPKKIEAIQEVKRPKNQEEIKRFLGMTTYYSKFIPNASSITYPLRCLLKKNRKFQWDAKCELAFIKIKELIASDYVLMPFNPELPITLACDASPTGVAAVLSHKINEEERPIAFASRSLTPAEQNYSQLDREALAIVFGVDKFFMYTYGRKFELITDNRPIMHIFHHNSKLPPITAARLLRYASFLQNFNYTIHHKKAEEHVHVDCLSRSPIPSTMGKIESSINQEMEMLYSQVINQISTVPLTFKSIVEETKKDAALSKLKKDLQSDEINDKELSIEHGVIFYKNRIMIPQSLQPFVLEELHKTHTGIVKMKQLARRYVYWRKIDFDIEQLVKSCKQCALIKNTPTKVPFHSWSEAEENFERIHIDYAGPYQGYQFLVVIDAKSKWIEIKYTRNAPSTESTIQMLKQIFTFHGLPRIIVSDNASIFQSEKFKLFCANNGIFQNFIAPGHPATNGLAERMVQMLKMKLAAMNENAPMEIKINEILYKYRSTPLASGKTPSELYLGRNIRTKLDSLKPPKEKLGKIEPRKEKVRNLNENDRVQARWYHNNKNTWRFGKIIKRFGNLHYLIKLDNGYIFKRHINQLRKCLVPETLDLSEGKLPDAKHVKFNENIEIFPSEIRIEPEVEVENTPHREIETRIPDEQAIAPQNQKHPRQRRPPARLGDYLCY